MNIKTLHAFLYKDKDNVSHLKIYETTYPKSAQINTHPLTTILMLRMNKYKEDYPHDMYPKTIITTHKITNKKKKTIIKTQKMHLIPKWTILIYYYISFYQNIPNKVYY